MDRLRSTVVPLRILLVLLFLGLLMGQTLSMPGQFAHMAEQDPDAAYLRWPLTVWAIALLACVQVVVVCTWRLLDMVRADRIFSDEAFRWVDAIIAAIAVGWVLWTAVGVYLAWLESDPGPAVAITGVSVTGAVVGLLMVVMRALLRQATELRTDLDGVI